MSRILPSGQMALLKVLITAIFSEDSSERSANNSAPLSLAKANTALGNASRAGSCEKASGARRTAITVMLSTSERIFIFSSRKSLCTYFFLSLFQHLIQITLHIGPQARVVQHLPQRGRRHGVCKRQRRRQRCLLVAQQSNPYLAAQAPLIIVANRVNQVLRRVLF